MFANCRTLPVFPRRWIAAASALAVAGALSIPASGQTQRSNGIVHIPKMYSSSASYTGDLNTKNLVGDNLISPIHPHMHAAGQYGGQYGSRYPRYGVRSFSRIAFEVSGGMMAPIGNDTHGYEDVGWNFRIGGGMNFSKRFGALVEFMWKRNPIPSPTLAVVGTTGGYIGDWAFTLDPIIYQPFNTRFGMYVTGGGGIDHKTTAFTNLYQTTSCYYFCYTYLAPVVVNSFSSTQGTVNIGIGFYWKPWGEESHAKLFIQSRYIWIDSPAPTSSQNGEGTEGLFPLSVGVRF